MRRIALMVLAIGFLVPLLASAPAHAQASRTWVSGVGDDVNPCSRTAPCKTFAGAISKTAAGGEINCLDPGGFGGITITKSMTLNCHEVFGSILVAGSNGVTIAAGATDRVVLRGLQIQGLLGTPTPGLNGVRIIGAGVVSIEDCVITQFSQQGISDVRTTGNTKLFVRNTVVSHNGTTGIAFGATAPNNAVIEDSHVVNNQFGIAAGNGTLAMVTRSVISGNTTGIEADPGAGFNLDSVVISNSTTGVQSSNNIRLSNSDVTFNTTGFSGTWVSYGNNRLQGNGSLGTSPTAAGGASSDLGEQ
jgi:hypothetical protein